MSGDDILRGGSGNNILKSGIGNDTLTGNSRSNVFVLESIAETDVITNFTDGEDFIGLSDSLTFNYLMIV